MLQPVALVGHTSFEGQISAVQTHQDFVAVASSRLEGSTWDGAVTLLRAMASAPSTSSSSVVTVELTRLAVHGTTYGIPTLTWCGAAFSPSLSTPQSPLLAAAQDNGDVLLLAFKDDGVNATLLPTTTLADHDDLVSALAASPEVDLLATGGWDCMVKVWGLSGSTVRPLMNWQAHSDQVTALAWRGAGGREGGKEGGYHQVASAGKDGCVKLWDVRMEGCKRECLRLVDADAQIPLALAWATSTSPSTSSFSSSSSPSFLPPPSALEGSNAMYVHDHGIEEKLERENDALLSVAFDDGSVSLLDLRMLRGERGGGQRTVISSAVKAHKTRSNALSFSTCASSSSPPFLASGGDDGQVVVTPLSFEEDESGRRATFASKNGKQGGSSTPDAASMQHTDYVRGLGWLATVGRRGQGEGAVAAAAAAASPLSSLPRPGVLLSGGWDGRLKGWAWGQEGEMK